MPNVLTGGCACGAIRYECSTPPIGVVNCHCRDCQRSSGTAFSTIAVFPTPVVKVTRGEPRSHIIEPEPGKPVRRSFCGDCGSPLFSGSANNPPMTNVKVGSFDDPAGLKPRADVWLKSALPWAPKDPQILKFETRFIPPNAK